jgi:hypothetical protein
MALVQTSSLISSIKGSVGGTTFSMNRAGLVAKSRLTGKKSMTSQQRTALNTSMAATHAWNELTFSQKGVFNAYALANEYTDRYGVVKPLTGYQWFKQLSQTSAYFTGNQLTAPPAYAVPAALPGFSLNLIADNITVVWDTPIDVANLYIYLYATPPVRAKSALQRGSYRFLDVRSLDVETSFSILTQWNDAFGLTYESITSGANFYINVLIYAIERTSFNSGIAVTETGSTP